MLLPHTFYEQIIDHAKRGEPEEVCGLVAGFDGSAVKLYETTNDASLPRVRYNIAPLELLRVLREIEDQGWQLMAIYHSHPRNRAYPSETDVSLAYYPDAAYIIVSLAEREAAMRAFKIVNGQIEEQELLVEPVEKSEAEAAHAS